MDIQALLDSVKMEHQDKELSDIVRTIERSALEIHLLRLNTQVEAARQVEITECCDTNDS